MRKNTNQNLLRSVLMGTALGALVMLLIFFAASIFIEKGLLSEDLIFESVLTASFLGAFFGALFSVRKKAPPFNAVLVGLTLAAVKLVLSAFMPGGKMFSPESLKLLGILVFGGLLAGILRSGRRKRRV